MTFLEYVLKQTLGPPDSINAGQSYWPCPRCDHRSFATLPHKEGYKDRFKCWRCAFFGDEFDLLQEHFPDMKYPRRRIEIERLKRDFHRQQDSDMPSTKTTRSAKAQGHHHSSSSADVPKPDQRRMNLAFSELTERLDPRTEPDRHDGLWVIVHAADVADHYEISLDDLVLEVATFLAFIAKTESKHAKTCDDPECEMAVCREKRGLAPLPPMTSEERQAEREAREKEHEARMARARKAVKCHSVNGRSRKR